MSPILYFSSRFKPASNYEIVTNPYKTFKRYYEEPLVPLRKNLKFTSFEIDVIYLFFTQILDDYGQYGVFEKVLWEIPIEFDGIRFDIAHKKSGFAIRGDESNLSKAALQAKCDELCAVLKKIIPITEKQISPFLKKLVDNQQYSIISRYTSINNKYQYYREIVFKDTLDKSNYTELDINEGKDKFIESYMKNQRVKYSHEYHTISMIDSYFSLLEHLMVLLVPFLSHIKMKNFDVGRFIGLNWKEKFKIIFSPNKEIEAQKLFSNLITLKEQVRNPGAHGFFDKGTGSLYVQIPVIGLTPIQLTKANSRMWNYSLIDDHGSKNIDAFKLFDEMDNYLNTFAGRFGYRLIQEDFPIHFDQKSSTRYRQSLRSDKSCESFIKRQGEIIERGINMDF